MSYHHVNFRMILMASVISIAITFQAHPLPGCTIAVVSGQVTEDGRPLLWKNRDTDSTRNMVQVFTDGPHRVMAVVDAEDPDRIWMGMNEAGLCLVNSLSLDLPGGSKTGRGNGRFMKLALQNCATADDFENLLKETNRTGRRTRANFGVIDPHGAALIFETGHRSFVKFDANDAQANPRGYVVRSNFAMTAAGAKHQGKALDFLKVYSGRRYLRAERLVSKELKRNGKLNYRFFLQNLSRDISDVLDGPLYSVGFESSNGKREPQSWFAQARRVNTQSTINRRNTVSAVVFHGVKPGTEPEWTTMWTLLGEPAFSVAVPCWISSSQPCTLLCGQGRSPLCTAARQIRQLNYESPNVLSTRWLEKIWAETLTVENKIIQQTTARMQAWRKAKDLPKPEEIALFQEALAKSALQSLLGVETRIRQEPAMAEKPAEQQLANRKTRELATMEVSVIGE